MENIIKLQTDSVLQVPFLNYQNDFTFIINSERFEMSVFAADLLSTKISKIHLIDPTIKEFSFNTEARGDFNKILKLVNFERQQFSEEELPYIAEIIETLELDKVFIDIKSERENEEISIDNLFPRLEKHQKYPKLYSKQLKEDISFFISHFYELKEKLMTKIKEDKYDIEFSVIEEVIKNPKLKLDTEDDLVEFLNVLYKCDVNYSILYEYVEFNNVSCSCMKKFIEKFDFNDLNFGVWSAIAIRLGQEIKSVDEESVKKKTRMNICLLAV